MKQAELAVGRPNLMRNRRIILASRRNQSNPVEQKNLTSYEVLFSFAMVCWLCCACVGGYRSVGRTYIKV